MRKILVVVIVLAVAVLAVLPAAVVTEAAGRRPRPTIVPIVTLVPPPVCPDGCPRPDTAQYGVGLRP